MRSRKRVQSNVQGPGPSVVRGPSRSHEKTRRTARGELNRKRLIEAAISILLGEGMAKFTSAQIAEAAGLHKPAFYAHFKNVDACLQQVALHVADANVQDSLLMHTRLLGPEQPLPDTEQSAEIIEQLLRAVRKHDSLYRLLRRYCTAEGTLGDALRDINDNVLDQWVKYFWRLAVRCGIDAEHFKEVSHLAEHVVGITQIAIARVLDDHVDDLSAEAARVARYNRALVEAEFRRMLADGGNPVSAGATADAIG